VAVKEMCLRIPKYQFIYVAQKLHEKKTNRYYSKSDVIVAFIKITHVIARKYSVCRQQENAVLVQTMFNVTFLSSNCQFGPPCLVIIARLQS